MNLYHRCVPLQFIQTLCIHKDAEKERHVYRQHSSNSMPDTEMVLIVLKEGKGGLSEKPASSGLPGGCHPIIHQEMCHRIISAPV